MSASARVLETASRRASLEVSMKVFGLMPVTVFAALDFAART